MYRIGCLLVFVAASPIHGEDMPSTDDAYDLALLKENTISADVAGLLKFFRDRTLDGDKVNRIRELVRQLGNARFQIRDRAAKELFAVGVPALRFLEEASRSPDSEVAQRAERLGTRIRSGPGPGLPIAALRQLRKHESPDSVPVLLDYLPFVDDASVEEELLLTLIRIAVRNGRPDARLCDALTDRVAPRRAAAGLVVGRSSDEQERRKAARLLDDANPNVRFRTAEGLVAGRDKAGVRALINLLTADDEELAWRAVELLRRIAGETSPEPPGDDKAESRRQHQEAWGAWWKKNAGAINLANLPADPPLLGYWVGIEYNTNSVWECGRDRKRRWTIKAEGPMDAHVLPGNRVLIAEQTAKRVTERDLKGNILWQFDTDEETLNCRRLPNGNTFIGTRFSVMEVRPNKSVVFRHKLSDNYLHAVRRMPNGNFVGITSTGVIHEINPAGKNVRTVTLASEGTWGDVEGLPGGRYLVANYGIGYVREVDASGKTVREVKVPDACGLNRLPNGQLVVSGQGTAKIVDWGGKSSWDVTSDGCIRRIHQR